MNRKIRYDQIDFSPSRITQRDDDDFGKVTVFHDVVIAREIVHQYDNGMAYKPAQELEAAAWTAEGRWVVIGRHPDTAIVSSRGDIGGRTVNVRFTKSLIDPKTDRPNNRGILADVEVFDSRVDPDILMGMKSGTRRDVSIGFFFDEDTVPGTIEDDKHPLNGTSYDYIQRNIMIDHTAAALDTGSGRCTMPYCGIGADQFKTLVTGDPVGPYETFGICVAAIMKKNPSYTREQAEGTCGKMEKQTKEKDFISTEEDKLSMKQTFEEIKTALQTILDSIPSLETAEDDLVEEEYQGNAAPMTKSKRAQMHFSIPEEIWEGLSEEEKDDYISRLPPEKERAGGEEMSDRDNDDDCVDCDDEEVEPATLADEDVVEEVSDEVIEEVVEKKTIDPLENFERLWPDVKRT